MSATPTEETISDKTTSDLDDETTKLPDESVGTELKTEFPESKEKNLDCIEKSELTTETHTEVENKATEELGVCEANGAIETTKVTEKDEHKTEKDELSSEHQKNKTQKKVNRTYPDGILKTSARIKGGMSNSKYDPSVLPTTDNPKEIREQVEFYFGDANLPSDKYLWGLTEGSSNLPVPIKKICEFGRMRRFKPYSAIVSALKESQLLKVSGEEGEEVVERMVPYDPDIASRDTVESRSIYAKGFGDEEPSSQFDIEAFFASYGPINAVRLRRTPEKLFKGSVFVEFTDEETAHKFLNLSNKPLWKGQHVLKIMSQKAYTNLKMEEIKSGKVNRPGNGFKGRAKYRGMRGKNNDQNRKKSSTDDPDNWKKRRQNDQASGFKNDHHRNNGRRGKYGRGRGQHDKRENHKKTNVDDQDKHSESKEELKSLSNNNESESLTSDVNSSEAPAATKRDIEVEGISTENFDQQTTSSPSKKRFREDDGDHEQNSSKKLDTKTDVIVEA